MEDMKTDEAISVQQANDYIPGTITTSLATREDWLNARINDLRGLFVSKAIGLPEKIKVSCGWPSSGGMKPTGAVKGQCFQAESSVGGWTEIFVSPRVDDAVEVLAILVHELIHASGITGHKKDFRKAAEKVGLVGDPKATEAGPELRADLEIVAASAGAYPHAKLVPVVKEKAAQKGRMLKFECTGCAWKGRAAKATLVKGVPSCPVNGCEKYGQTMTVEEPSEGSEGE